MGSIRRFVTHVWWWWWWRWKRTKRKTNKRTKKIKNKHLMKCGSIKKNQENLIIIFLVSSRRWSLHTHIRSFQCYSMLGQLSIFLWFCLSVNSITNGDDEASSAGHRRRKKTHRLNIYARTQSEISLKTTTQKSQDLIFISYTKNTLFIIRNTKCHDEFIYLIFFDFYPVRTFFLYILIKSDQKN